MAYEDRAYNVYVILGGTALLPWTDVVWREIHAALVPLANGARGKAAVRCSQLGGEPPRMKGIAFGRLGLDEASRAKWTHERDGQLTSGVSAMFLTAEVWAPSWSACEKEGAPPDVFFDMSGERYGAGGGNDFAFGSAMVLAVASELELETQTKESALGIADATKAVLVRRQMRPWGVSTGYGSFTDAIQDLNLTGLFAPGPRHARPAGEGLLQGQWRLP